MFKKHPLFSTLIIQSICGIVLMYLVFTSAKHTIWASPMQVAPATPQPFLGAVYYGSSYVYNVFDHNLPCASVCADNNNDVLHRNGITYFAVTGTPDPAASPTPTHWPTVTPYIPDAGYGYDEHAGIDYGLKYEPVLAAADGKVTVADWHHHSNHHLGFGLYVQVSHEEHNSYSTLYAHLSVVTVRKDENIQADPRNRDGIIGISGNTGAVFGCGAKGVEEDPLCGTHLHFETRKGTDYHPMNPYGYVGTTTPDPWPANANYGAVSYPLWATLPAISGTPQYPVGPTVSAPPAPVAARTIDDADPEFDYYPIDPEPCMEYSAVGGLYGSFRYTEINAPTYCEAFWQITPNELTEAGWYDVYVYIPEITWTNQISLTRGAEYTIISDLMPPQTAIVVQAAYPNESHLDRWVYIGRYQFSFESNDEYIRVSNQTLDDDGVSFIVAADAIQLAPVNPGQPITPTATPPPPTATPVATATTTATLTPVSLTPTASATPSATPSPTSTATATPTPTPTASPVYYLVPATAASIDQIIEPAGSTVTCNLSSNTLVCSGNVASGNDWYDHGAKIVFQSYTGRGTVVGFAVTQLSAGGISQYKTGDMLGRNGTIKTDPFVNLQRCYGTTVTLPAGWSLGCDQYYNKFDGTTLYASLVWDDGSVGAFSFSFGSFNWIISQP